MAPPLLGNLGTKFSEMSFPHFKTYYTQIGRCYLFNTQQLKMIDSKNFTLSSMSSFQNAWPIIWKKKLQKFTNNYWIKDCNFNWVIFGLNPKSWLDKGKRWKSAKNNAFNRTGPLKVLSFIKKTFRVLQAVNFTGYRLIRGKLLLTVAKSCLLRRNRHWHGKKRNEHKGDCFA